jgi:hypothetical protein
LATRATPTAGANPIVTSERVQLVDDDHLHTGEQSAGLLCLLVSRTSIDSGVVRSMSGWLPPNCVLVACRDIAMPERNTSPHPAAVSLQPHVQVVEQRLDRTEVEHRQAGPLLLHHSRQHREAAASVLPPAVGASSSACSSLQQRLDRQLLQRPQ